MNLFPTAADQFRDVLLLLKTMEEENKKKEEDKTKKEKKPTFSGVEMYVLLLVLSVTGGPLWLYIQLWGYRECLLLLKTMVQP